MKIIKLKCPECNATLEVNGDLENVTCNYCGTKIIIEDEKETGAERIIKRLGKELERSRNYYSSNEYKERLKIQNEQEKINIKRTISYIIPIFIIFFGIPILIGNFLDKANLDKANKESMTCTLNNKEYVIIMQQRKKVSCASCDENMLNEFNEKYYDRNDVSITKKNIKAYFTNNSGVCED